MPPPVQCEQLCCLLAGLSTLAVGVDEIFAAGVFGTVFLC